MKIQVLTVKWGDKFDSSYVNRIYDMVKANTSFDITMRCYTDDCLGIRDEVEIIPIPEDNKLEVWWNKLSLFNPDVIKDDDLCLYLDLDVVIQNNIDKLIESNRPGKVKIYRSQKHLNSSVMLWTPGDGQEIWDKFTSDQKKWINTYRGIDEFIWHQTYCFSLFPKGMIYSRLFGDWYDTHNQGPRETARDVFDFYDKPDYMICIFNGLGHNFDESAYEGFEHYWLSPDVLNHHFPHLTVRQDESKGQTIFIESLSAVPKDLIRFTK